MRTTADPELDLPKFGSSLNAGNHYRWLLPAHPGDALERRSRVAEAYVREGSTGHLTFLVVETEVRRADGAVIAVGRSTTVQRRPR